MTVFTVHERHPREDEVSADPERTVFVRDGFYFWAFVLGPLWMLWNRLWLVLIAYLAASTAIQFGLHWLGVASGVKFAVGFLIAVLVGCEAGTLRRWSLRRRYSNVGLVVAPDQELAERRFFEAGIGAPLMPAAVPVQVMPAQVAPVSPDVLGLFPQPEPRR